MLLRLTAGLLICLSTAAHSQNFSCRIGDRGACLGFGDTVCSSSGRCVNNDALCFDRYQCNYEGFTCKSNVTACVDDYNDLLERRNTLADAYSELLEANGELVEKFNELLNANNELVDDYNALLEENNDLVGAYNALLADHRAFRADYDDLFSSYEDTLQRLSDAEAERDIFEDQALRRGGRGR